MSLWLQIAFERRECGILRDKSFDSIGETMALQQLPASGGSIFPPYHMMLPGQYLESPNKRFRLVFQSDNNLALYDGPTAVWAGNGDVPYSREIFPYSWSAGAFNHARMSYSLGVDDLPRNRIWSTTNSTPADGNTTAAMERAYLQVQDDGNLVIVDAIIVWTNNTTIPVAAHLESAIVPSGTVLQKGQSIKSGQVELIVQSDGNMVMYGPNSSVLLQTYTQNGEYAVMQTDGNFVLFDAGNNPVWMSNTGQFPGAHLRVQANGNIAVVYDKVVWARSGFVPEIKPVKTLVQYGPFTIFKYNF